MSQDNLMKYVPVEVNKWGEMVQAMTRVKELEADLEKSDGVVWTLSVENARLKAEVERLTKENETINKDRTLLWASHKIALQDIQGLHYALQTAKEGKQS